MPITFTDPAQFKDMVRMISTNVDGRRPLYLALCNIPGIGRRFAFALCRSAGYDPLSRAGTLTDDQQAHLISIIQNPVENGIPVWMLNRRFDRTTGKDVHWVATDLNSNPRNEIERLKKMRCKRGIRHGLGLKVRGQCTKSTGRHGGAIGVQKKKD